MKLKEQIKIFDESFKDSSGEPTKVPVDLFAPVEQLQREIRDKDKIIENLKNESTELMNQISIIEKEKYTILEDLEKSKWLENKVTLATKKVYEDKVKSIIDKNVDSKLIPVLTAVARKKQGNQQLTLNNWLKIPENKYLFQVNESIARKEFEDTNALIGRRLDNESIRGSGGQTTTPTTIYGLQFDGITQSVNTTFSENGATPVPRTYSWWMKASVGDEANHSVFGYGFRKREAFHLNFGGADRPLTWISNARYIYWDDGTVNDTPQQDDGRWHHWIVYNDVENGPPAGSKLYIDGVNIPTYGGNGGALQNHLSPLCIGASDDGGSDSREHFEGSLSNFAVYTGDKTANAVSHYNNGIPKDLSGEDDLEGYWKMDEGEGSTVSDHSGNDNHGTLRDEPTWITVMEI